MEYHDIVAGGGSAGWVAWPGSARPSSLPLWVPIILSVALIWSYAFTLARRSGDLAARVPRARALSVLLSLRLSYLAMFRVFSWLALLAGSDHAKDAEILTSSGGSDMRRTAVGRSAS